MALSGIQIYKLLPQTNCKECSFPTCLAFAMKLAAKQVELGACPYVSEASKKQLAESAAPPIRLITLKSDGKEVKVGNEVCMYRHEKTFYNKPGLFLRVKASDPDLAKKVATADAYKVNYVGMDFSLDGFAIEADGDLPAAVKAVRDVTRRPLILIGNDPAALELQPQPARRRSDLDLRCRFIQLRSPGGYRQKAQSCAGGERRFIGCAR